MAEEATRLACLINEEVNIRHEPALRGAELFR